MFDTNRSARTISRDVVGHRGRSLGQRLASASGAQLVATATSTQRNIPNRNGTIVPVVRDTEEGVAGRVAEEVDTESDEEIEGLREALRLAIAKKYQGRRGPQRGPPQRASEARAKMTLDEGSRNFNTTDAAVQTVDPGVKEAGKYLH